MTTEVAGGRRLAVCGEKAIGVRIFLEQDIEIPTFIQNIGQVKRLYDKNWETFLGNAGAIIAWGLNDLEKEKYLNDRMGPIRD